MEAKDLEPLAEVGASQFEHFISNLQEAIIVLQCIKCNATLDYHCRLL